MSAELAKVVPIADKVGPKRSPKLRPIRPSAQEVAYHCGYSVTLAEQYRQGSEWSEGGTSDHKKMTAAFRAMTPPKEPNLARMYDVITGTWMDATWETDVKIQVFDPETGERLVPEGTGEIDLLGTLPSGALVVIDFKFGAREVPHPDENPQILCYGYGIATEREAPSFVPVIYQPLGGGMTQGRPQKDGDDYWAILDRLRVAATRDPDLPITGSHCDACYVRTPYCRAFAAQAVEGETALAKYDPQDIQSWSDERLASLLLQFEALAERLKDAKANLKDEARRRGGIRDNGKIFGPSLRRGRRSVSIAKIEAYRREDDALDGDALMALLEERGLVSSGGHIEYFTWRNAKKGAGEDGHGGSHE